MGFKKVLRSFAILLIFLSFLINPTTSFAQENVATSSATTVNDFNSGVSINTTVIDVDSGDGSVANTLGPETVSQSQTTGTVAQNFDNANWLAQTSTATMSGLLSKVTLSLDRNNSVNTEGSLSLELRNTTAGIPSSTTLATSSILASTVSQTGQEDNNFSFSSLPALESGTSYSLVLYRSGFGTITADYNWYRGSAGSGNNQYLNGSRFTSSDSGATWTEQTVANPGTGDLRFTTFIRSYATSGTQSSNVANTGSVGTEFTQISWNENLQSGTDITFEVRGSRTSFAKINTSPSWVSLGSANSPASLETTGNYQYFQWRATLSGTPTSTPSLKDVTATYKLPATVSNVSSSTPSSTSAAVFWTTSYPTSSRIIYDTIPHSSLGDSPNYGYIFSTGKDDTKVTNHQMTINGLRDGTTYYYRVVSEGSPTAIGEEKDFRTLTPAGPPVGGATSPADSEIAADTSSQSPVVLAVNRVKKVSPPVEKEIEEVSGQVFGEEDEVTIYGETAKTFPVSPNPLAFLFEAVGSFLVALFGFFTRLFSK